MILIYTLIFNSFALYATWRLVSCWEPDYIKIIVASNCLASFNTYITLFYKE